MATANIHRTPDGGQPSWSCHYGARASKHPLGATEREDAAIIAHHSVVRDKHAVGPSGEQVPSNPNFSRTQKVLLNVAPERFEPTMRRNHTRKAREIVRRVKPAVNRERRAPSDRRFAVVAASETKKCATCAGSQQILLTRLLIQRPELEPATRFKVRNNISVPCCNDSTLTRSSFPCIRRSSSVLMGYG